MQYSSILAATAYLLASVSAAVLSREVINIFEVSDFSATGSRFSEDTDYSFNVRNLEAQDTAACSGVIATLPEISYLPATCCTSAAGACVYKFDFGGAPTGDGFDLTINYTKGALDVSGVKFFPQSDVVTVVDAEDPNGNYEYLNTTSAFPVVFR